MWPNARHGNTTTWREREEGDEASRVPAMAGYLRAWNRTLGRTLLCLRFSSFYFAEPHAEPEPYAVISLLLSNEIRVGPLVKNLRAWNNPNGSR
jgi:hypothetical protein